MILTWTIRLIPEDFEKIEKEMARIVDEDLPIFRKEWKKTEAVKYFRKQHEDLKTRFTAGA